MNTSAALDTLLSRYSLGVKHLTEPGPDAAQLQQMVATALRAPDHAELVPFRFVVVQGEARTRLADLFAEHAQHKGKGAEGVAIERERALRAPLTVAVLARIDLGHPLVPAHEQWMCVGGAVTNFLNAAHAMGFAGKMLSGDKARAPHIAQAFAEPGETLVGWVALGTPTRTPHGEVRKDAAQALRFW
ncbi:nitroreductase family protein [Rhodoferax saidenbachensis]|uniref:Putative NAD(P)H nitroreductase n=1 Tax=Rhodoferax saidenbachensis TaxID=1484693 RepID=A0A1P8KCS4_9BURK|nr:nitroreductase [Rhodoferax saidenbachensis]APW43824.1 nitroreductase [Rhodoferax saidenbachensis]